MSIKDPIRFAMPTFPGVDPGEISRLLSSGWLTNGERVREFEQAFAAYQGAPHAVALSSCTAALHLALMSHDVGPGHEVITSSFTFVATCNAIIQTGAMPVLVDIDTDSLNLDPDQVRAAITPRTRAVIPVHFAGLAVDLEPIFELSDRHNLAVIHDAAHAVETMWQGRRLGSLPHTACFSFYATKNLPIGEGGMLTTASEEIARSARALRSHGMTVDAYRRRDDTPQWCHWDVELPGFNYKMTEISALLGYANLPYVDGWRNRREALVRRYHQALAAIPGLRLSQLEPGNSGVHAHHLFVVRLEHEDMERDDLLVQLRNRGVEVAVNFRAVHELTWYRRLLGQCPQNLPRASLAGRRCVSLPLHPGLTDNEIDRVIETMHDLLEC